MVGGPAVPVMPVEHATGAAVKYPLPLPSPEYWLQHAHMRMAGDGAWQVNYGRRFGRAGWQFNPVTTAQFCLAAYNRALEGDGRMGALAVHAANGLRARAIEVPHGLAFRYGFTHRTFGVRAGWISGMAQGLAMACLTGARVLTRDRAYSVAARRAFGVLTAPMTRGGTAVRVAGGTFFEEVAAPTARPTHILNGMIYALSGIWFARHHAPADGYDVAFNSGVAAVRRLLPQYFAPGTSRYDLWRHIAYPGRYNLTHVVQLNWLGQATGAQEFVDAALRMATFERRWPFVARATVGGRPLTTDAYGGAVAPPGRPVTLRATFAPLHVDRIEVILRGTPASIDVITRGRTRMVRPTSRFVSIEHPSQTLDRVTLVIRPFAKKAVHLELLTLHHAGLHSLSVLSSDLDSYGRDDPSHVTDGDVRSVWSSPATAPYLMVGLDDANQTGIWLTRCALAHRINWSFSFDAHIWSPPAPVPEGTPAMIPVPTRARFVRLQWLGSGGCLAELGWATPRPYL